MIAGIVALVFYTACSSPPVQDDLMVELRKVPALGIQTQQPRFFWAQRENTSVHGTVDMWGQNGMRGDAPPTFARVQVFQESQGLQQDGNCSSPMHPSAVWDSGTIYTVNNNITFNSTGTATSALIAGSRYFFRVCLSSNSSSPSGWSSAGYFVMALWDTWTAKPIWSNSTTETFLYSHKNVSVASGKTLLSATVFITAQPTPSQVYSAKYLTSYKLFVCGDIVGMGPGRAGRCGPTFPAHPFEPSCSPEHVYDVYDVTDRINTCLNAVCWFICEQFKYIKLNWCKDGFPLAFSAYSELKEQGKVMLELRMTYTDGSSQVVTTDSSWQVWAADSYMSPTKRCCKGYYGHPFEDYIAEREPLNWKTQGFAGAVPQSINATEYNRSFSNGAPLVSKYTPALEILPNIPVTLVKRNDTHGVWIYDVGKEVMGGLKVTFEDGVNGTVVNAGVGEEYLPSGQVMTEMRTGNNYNDKWTLKDGVNHFEHHEYMEFRYIQISVQLPPPPPPPPAQCYKSNVAHNSPAVARLSCVVKGDVISKVIFASYGRPEGDCIPSSSDPSANNFTSDSHCNAPKSVAVVESDCIGKESCTVNGYPSTMGGDPCDGLDKWIAVAVTCSPNGRTPIPVNTNGLSPPNVSIWVVRYPFAESDAMMTTDSSDLNAVWELCKYTLEATTIDMYTDSNTRQRDPVCMESVNINAWSHYYSTKEFLAQRYTIEYSLNQPFSQLGLQQGLWPAEWYPITIMAVYTWTLQTGDLSFLKQYYDKLKDFTWQGFLNNSLGLVDCRVGSGASNLTKAVCNTIELDWPSNMRDGWNCDSLKADGSENCREVSTVLNAYAVRGMQWMAEMASWLGINDDVDSFSAKVQALRDGMQKRMFNGSLWCDGLCQSTTHSAWHTNVFASAFQVMSPDSEADNSTFQYIAERALLGADGSDSHQEEDDEWCPGGGPSGGDVCWHSGMPANVYLGQWILEALYAHDDDHGRAGLRMLVSKGTNAWLNMIKQGATATMEAWTRKEKPNLTWSHPWAASPANVIPRLLFGIKALLPGYSRVEIKPQPGTLKSGTITIPTVRGALTASFNNVVNDEGLSTRFDLRVILPVGVTGHVLLPYSSISDNIVSMNRKHSVPCHKVRDYCLVEVQSGDILLSSANV
eukprot:m.83920 g.83920  ORF g.83920 m.83920 type:complete len:1143 (-) comp12945_c1_seq2:86-3514(-)